ncbi:hypothetical protein PSPO01_06156 [Paraphaeosphaeria sporulosa]
MGWECRRGARRLKQRRLWVCFKGRDLPHRETPFFSGKQATSSYINVRRRRCVPVFLLFVQSRSLGLGVPGCVPAFSVYPLNLHYDPRPP